MSVCVICGYDLRGSPGPQCPECGATIPVPYDEMALEWTRYLTRARRLHTWGVPICLIGLPAWLILRSTVVGFLGVPLAFLGGLFCAATGAGMYLWFLVRLYGNVECRRTVEHASSDVVSAFRQARRRTQRAIAIGLLSLGLAFFSLVYAFISLRS
jgi:hypothetical protein